MEKAIKEEKAINVKEKNKRKRSKWDAFVNFLACGGFMLILVALVGIFLLVCVLFKIKF